VHSNDYQIKAEGARQRQIQVAAGKRSNRSCGQFRFQLVSLAAGERKDWSPVILQRHKKPIFGFDGAGAR
jgi:hypothetical protein